MANGPYFVWQTTDHLMLGADGKLHDKGDALRSGLLCKFGTMNAAKKYIADSGLKNLQPITAKTARGHLGFPEDAWNQILKLVHDGVDPDWKPTFTWDSGRSAVVKMLPNPDNSPDPQQPSCPAPIPADGAEEASAQSSLASPTGCKTPRHLWPRHGILLSWRIPSTYWNVRQRWLTDGQKRSLTWETGSTN